jgi:hypothetical protein
MTDPRPDSAACRGEPQALHPERQAAWQRLRRARRLFERMTVIWAELDAAYDEVYR